MSAANPLPDGRLYRKRVQLRILAGDWEPFVDSQPAIDHVSALREQGLSVKAIADLADLPFQTVNPLAWDVRGRRPEQIRPTTRDAILAVTFDLDRIPGHRRIPGLATKRRVQGLAAIGYTMSWLGGQLGVTAIIAARYGHSTYTVTAARARDIRDVYQAHENTPGPSDTVAYRSRLKGWAPPASWDDIENPRETPKGMGDFWRQVAARDVEIRRLRTEHGLGLNAIGARMKCSRATVTRALDAGETA